MNQEHTEKYITILPLVLLTVFTIAYLPAFQKLLKQWAAGDNSYCYLIVPLFLYLLYDKKNRFYFAEFSWSLWGLVPIIFSVLLMVVGELGSVRALMFMGIWGCVVGLCVMLYGKRAQQLAFPLFILFFIVPLPPFVNRMLTFKLKMAASKLSVWMLRAVGVSVSLEGNIIDLGLDKLQVADACSGLRYFMPMILMAVLVAYFFVKGRLRWTALLLLIVPLSIFINAVRIWMSALFVVNGHPELAHNLFHDFSGWLMFMIAGAILVGVALVLKKFSYPGGIDSAFHRASKRTQKEEGRRKREEHKEGRLEGEKVRRSEGDDVRNQMSEVGKDDLKRTNQPTNPTGLVKPILITIVLCVLFAGSGWALKEIPSSSHLPKRMSFDHFPMQIGQWHGEREYIPQNILKGLWADDYVTARYFKDGSSNMIYLLIPFYKYQVTNHAAHAPQACILGSGFSLIRSREHLIPVGSGKRIRVMTMVLEKGDIRMLGSYFFLHKGRVITSPWMNKFYLIWDGIFKQRTDGALVRAEMTVAPGQTMDAAYVELEGFIAKLWPILSDYVPS